MVARCHCNGRLPSAIRENTHCQSTLSAIPLLRKHCASQALSRYCTANASGSGDCGTVPCHAEKLVSSGHRDLTWPIRSCGIHGQRRSKSNDASAMRTRIWKGEPRHFRGAAHWLVVALASRSFLPDEESEETLIFELGCEARHLHRVDSSACLLSRFFGIRQASFHAWF